MTEEARDALLELPTERFYEYLHLVYARMARETNDRMAVIEIGTRIWRGVITPQIIPHRAFMAIDRNKKRPGLTMDVLERPIYADAILSTCVLHHTHEEDVPQVLANLRAPLLMFSGPTADTHDPYGDHRWHLEEGKLRAWLNALGYHMTWERFGLTEPYCEAIVVARRTA